MSATRRNPDAAAGLPSEAAAQLTWRQALSWRMQRHHLLSPAPAADALQVVSDICGLHAQLTSSARASLAIRTWGLPPDFIDRALQERTLVKLWTVRGTLHLLPASDYPLWQAALSTQRKHGNRNNPEIDALCDAIAAILPGRCLTRSELADAIQRHTGSTTLADYVRFSWGSYLKAAAYRGLLCFATPVAGGSDVASEASGTDDDAGEGEQGSGSATLGKTTTTGRHALFTAPATWLPPAHRPDPALDPAEALREVTRRILSAYGPLTPADLGRWWSGESPAVGRRMLAALGDDVAALDLRDTRSGARTRGETTRAYALARDLDDLVATQPTRATRHLPAFDPWTLGISLQPQALAPGVERREVFRPQGWVSAVLASGASVTPILDN